MKMGWKLSIAAAATLLAASTAYAQPRGGPGHRPPKEAIDACARLEVGDSCSFTLEGRTLKGTCRGPADRPAACAPYGLPPPDGHRRPPQEALDACAKLKAGDACSFTFDGRALSGTCRGPADKPAACAPEGMSPPGGHHGPPPAALDACKSLRDGDTCSFSIDGREVKGSCRTGPEGQPAACLPSDMPRR